MPALPRISWCADKGFLYFDIERKKYTIPVLHCYREFTQNLGQPRRPRPFPRCHDSNANSMAANVDETQNASWRDIAKIKPV
jgi:hypothetical protein